MSKVESKTFEFQTFNKDLSVIQHNENDARLQLKEELKQLDLDHQGLYQFIISNQLYFQEIVNYIELRGEFFIADSIPESDPRGVNLFTYFTGQAEERVCKGVETRFDLRLNSDGATFQLKVPILNKLRAMFERYLFTASGIKKVRVRRIISPCSNKANEKCMNCGLLDVVFVYMGDQTFCAGCYQELSTHHEHSTG